MAGYAQQGTCLFHIPVTDHPDAISFPFCLFPVDPKIHEPLDAEECFGQIINTLRNVPGLPGPSSVAVETAGAEVTKKFVEQYLMGQMRRELSIYLLCAALRSPRSEYTC